MAQSQPVIAVGAGIAGLAAAAQIAQAGLPVLVLEARDALVGAFFTERELRNYHRAGNRIHSRPAIRSNGAIAEGRRGRCRSRG
jgi:phytoene dehydrogenase-like protein